MVGYGVINGGASMIVETFSGKVTTFIGKYLTNGKKTANKKGNKWASSNLHENLN